MDYETLKAERLLHDIITKDTLPSATKFFINKAASASKLVLVWSRAFDSHHTEPSKHKTTLMQLCKELCKFEGINPYITEFEKYLSEAFRKSLIMVREKDFNFLRSLVQYWINKKTFDPMLCFDLFHQTEIIYKKIHPESNEPTNLSEEEILFRSALSWNEVSYSKSRETLDKHLKKQKQIICNENSPENILKAKLELEGMANNVHRDLKNIRTSIQMFEAMLQ